MNAGKFDPSDLPEPLRRKLQSQLDRLPEQYRHNIEAQLSRLPTDQLRQLVERGSPMLDKLIARADAASVSKPLAKPDAPTRASGLFPFRGHRARIAAGTLTPIGPVPATRDRSRP